MSCIDTNNLPGTLYFIFILFFFRFYGLYFYLIIVCHVQCMIFCSVQCLYIFMHYSIHGSGSLVVEMLDY